MSKILYVNRTFKESSLKVIVAANSIIEEYAGQGFSLTLRQLYYQFVARDLIPNTQREYKRIGGIINDARLAGLIDWDAIEDRTRNLVKNSHWDGPADIIRSAAESFALDKWADQDNYLEVWIEKEALIGVIEPICTRYDVPFFACRGYTSQSEQWRAGGRFHRCRNEERQPVILHLGDHDPSGIDMTRDNRDRLGIFTYGEGVEVVRLALNMDQVDQYSPPANPAKMTDSRFAQYTTLFGDDSWELDALEPGVISDLIELNIRTYLDLDKWNESLEFENAHKATLKQLAEDL